MRANHTWHQSLIPLLKKFWPTTSISISPTELCEVELGLYALSVLAPDTPAHALWTLLTGYNFPAPELDAWTEQQKRTWGNLRALLPYFQSHYPWERSLSRYQTLDASLRGYILDNVLAEFARADVTICANRWLVYDETLSHSLPFKERKVQWADAGKYTFLQDSFVTDVTIPSKLVFPAPASHRLQSKVDRKPISVTWTDLLGTAQWMDEKMPGSWHKRLNGVQLQLFDNDEQLATTSTLKIEGLMNLIGMVSSGKSTLMKVMAVWAAKNGLHVTLVVSDVMAALDLAQLFNSLDLAVAPILGVSNREKHTNRLHASLAAQTDSPLSYDHIGFRWLSTACPLDGLRPGAKPLAMGEQPCLSLRGDQGKYYACPIYNQCPIHQAQRDLVESSIWITTPAGLIYTRVAQQINTTDLRFAELVYRKSDLVIIDEADQVQAQLDVMFSPSQVLVSQGADWLGQLWQSVVPQLDSAGRGQLAQQEVDQWNLAHDTVQTVTNRIYSLLLQEPFLQKWVSRDYFTDWTLFDRIATKWSDSSNETRFENPDYKVLMQIFRDFMEDPLGRQRDHPLSDLAEKAVIRSNERLRPLLERWILEHTKNPMTQEVIAQWVLHLQFALLLAVLQERLNTLIRDWQQVEQTLNLESSSSAMFYSPPADYNSVVPAAPMGNVLAFQYLVSSDETNPAGDLRFFRCMGVGRWLLLHFHDLFFSDGIMGPQVILLSGTSWAGTSYSYHIQAPVNGILRAPQKEVEAITKDSIFQLLTFQDDNGQALRVSGKRGGERQRALKQMLNKLALRSGLGGVSLLEREKNHRPPDRQKILLLVGSYEEASVARQHIEQIRPDWYGQVTSLIPDDSADDTYAVGTRTLQRGRVAEFSETEAWLLIAPLLAIERGHNIINTSTRQAAIGSAYFLVRPHPHPTDLSFAIQAINYWAINRSVDKNWFSQNLNDTSLSLANMGRTFRNAAYRQWRHLLRLPLIYSTLPHFERDALAWSAAVTIWQVIGRLIRGGSPANVYFCDAAFAPHSAAKDGELDTPSTSLLVGIRHVLRPYFNENTGSAKEKNLVQALYGPFYGAMQQLRGIVDVETIQ